MGRHARRPPPIVFVSEASYLLPGFRPPFHSYKPVPEASARWGPGNPYHSACLLPAALTSSASCSRDWLIGGVCCPYRRGTGRCNTLCAGPWGVAIVSQHSLPMCFLSSLSPPPPMLNANSNVNCTGPFSNIYHLLVYF
jgi:hypothetical protein